MEEAVELGDDLPLSFNRPNEQGYVAFLWDAFETNYTTTNFSRQVPNTPLDRFR